MHEHASLLQIIVLSILAIGAVVFFFAAIPAAIGAERRHSNGVDPWQR